MKRKLLFAAFLLIPTAIWIIGPLVGIPDVTGLLVLYLVYSFIWLSWDMAGFHGRTQGAIDVLHMKVDAIGMMIAHGVMDENDHARVKSELDEFIERLKAQQEIAEQAEKLRGNHDDGDDH